MIAFSLQQAKQSLSLTPGILEHLLAGRPDAWTHNNEGADTWSPFDVLGHLIHGEKTDWITRAKKCLAQGDEKRFVPFDRFAQFEESKGKTLDQLLMEFRDARAANLRQLDTLNLTEESLDSVGLHPIFGEVTLRQLLSTWVAHDLDHIIQICRVMASQYADAVGPWKQYMRVMQPLEAYEQVNPKP